MRTPKVMEAQAIWVRWPRQIASDLSRFHHRRIADWHQGVMSSYELLELLEYPPEDGALARAIRDGERSEWQQMLAQVANEVAVLRAGQVQSVDGDEYGSMLWFSAAKLREMADRAEAVEDAREAVFAFADRTTKQ